MSRDTEMSKELLQSECASSEETSIKYRLRSASKGTLLSEGRQTPITFPSEDLAMAESCAESADEEVEHAGLLQDAWFENGLKTLTIRLVVLGENLLRRIAVATSLQVLRLRNV